MRSGAPGAIRTHDLPLRRRMLYPAELQGQKLTNASYASKAKFYHPMVARCHSSIPGWMFILIQDMSC